jgi:hypothetical protein
MLDQLGVPAIEIGKCNAKWHETSGTDGEHHESRTLTYSKRFHLELAVNPNHDFWVVF